MGDLTGAANRWLAILVSLFVAIASVVVFAPAAQADHGAGGSFDGTDGVLDPGTVNLVDVCGSGTDDVLRNGNAYKLNRVHTATTPPSVVIGGNAAPKADICDIWLATENVGDDVYLYLAWDRFATTGSTVFAFEFQQASLSCIPNPADPADTCNPFASRQSGDFLIIYDFQGNRIEIGLRVFDDGRFGPLIPLSQADFEASLSPDKSFGEAVINLTGNPPILPPDPDTCLSVANLIPMTITGNSDQAEVMDLVIDDLSDDIGISNCGSLEIVKHTVPAGLNGTFGVVVDGSELGSPLSGTLTGHGAVLEFVDLFAGDDYTVTESVPDGWSPDYGISCSLEDGTPTGAGTDVEIVINQTTTCEITNTAILPQLTLLKTVINDDGGTAVDTDWTLTATGPVTVSGSEGSAEVTAAELPIGSYSLSESGPSGYAAGPWMCDGVATDQVDLGPGDQVTCEVVNDDIAAHLTLVKVVVSDAGGEADPTAWTLIADGPTPLSGAGGVEGDVAPGTYTLSESGGPAGYEAGEWVCTGGVQVGNQVTVALADQVTCQIVNDDIAPLLTLVKAVINDDGGLAVAADFALSASGPVSITGATGDAAVTSAPVVAGTYVLSETGPDGYESLGWSCVGGTLSGDELTLALGQVATCTITNDDVPATLTLIKEVINDSGGTAVASDWTLAADGPTAVSGPSGSPDVTGVGVFPGVYTLSESGPAGYAAGEWICDGGVQDGAQVLIGLGDTVTCTIVNDDIPATLRLVKQVVNDDGGTAEPSEWLLTADGPVLIEGEGAVTATVPAGIYALSEVGPAGYLAGTWQCTGGPVEANLVNVPLATEVTCVIQNDDIAPTITLIKEVATGDAGPDDFGLTIDGAPVLSGVTVPVTANQPHVVAETGLAGYVQTDFSCVDDASGGEVEDPIVLGPGEAVTCTFVNNELGSITVVKQALPGGGEFSFTLAPGDTRTVSGNGGTTTWSDLVPGSYDLTELTPVDWTLEEVSCDSSFEPLATGAQIDIDYGAHVTCVFTNGQAPTLTIVKETTLPTDTVFEFSIGTAGFSLGGGASTTLTLPAGSHVVTESLPAGWQLDSVSCDGLSAQVENGVSVELAFGDNVTCTFTNSQVADLAITKIDAEDPLFLNDDVPIGTIIYTITVENLGPAAATGVTVVDTLAATTTFVSAFPSQGSCAHIAGVVTCDLGELAVGGQASITLTVLTEEFTALSALVVTNTVVVSGDQLDIVPENNQAVEDTSLVAVLALPPLTPPVTPQVPQVPQLPQTGVEAGSLAALALSLLGMGALILGLSRRRPDGPAEAPSG